MTLLALSPFFYFYDPVLRGPTIGSMLMCFTAAIVGVIVFLRKQSLLGEALSHAAYPGVMFGVMFAGGLSLSENQEGILSLLIMGGAFVSAFAGLGAIYLLERRYKIRSDAALCFVLSSFFGIGLTLASQVQFDYPLFYRQVQAYLYGQAATMSDIHILIYAILGILVIAVVALFYKELQVLTFDREWGKTMGIRTAPVDAAVFILIVLAIVIGIRSVGVVLMSAMLIAPASAARQFSNHLYKIFALAGLFGLISGYLGNYFSLEGTLYLFSLYPSDRLSLPTGPMIVMVASCICIGALFFAPERGFLLRAWRIARFRYRCLCENLLKECWRHGADKEISWDEIVKYQSASPTYLRWVLSRLVHNGWLNKVDDNSYKLTHDGQLWAAKIVRLHRLWEVYLVDYLGVGAERVHRNAEEMEHIITPQLEEELTLLLNNPKRDPHHQPIPPKELL